MLRPLFVSRLCSVHYVGCQYARSFAFPLGELNPNFVKNIKAQIKDNNLMVSFFIDDPELPKLPLETTEEKK
jgi:hypothetical protein